MNIILYIVIGAMAVFFPLLWLRTKREVEEVQFQAEQVKQLIATFAAGGNVFISMASEMDVEQQRDLYRRLVRISTVGGHHYQVYAFVNGDDPMLCNADRFGYWVHRLKTQYLGLHIWRRSGML